MIGKSRIKSSVKDLLLKPKSNNEIRQFSNRCRLSKKSKICIKSIKLL